MREYPIRLNLDNYILETIASLQSATEWRLASVKAVRINQRNGRGRKQTHGVAVRSRRLTRIGENKSVVKNGPIVGKFRAHYASLTISKSDRAYHRITPGGDAI